MIQEPLTLEQPQAPKQRQSLNTSEICLALQERYAAPEFALLFEVHNATGFGDRRSADALAMSLWPSRGLDLHGFEIKASRSDWIHEKKRPEKAETIAAYCDFWWLVVGDEKIVQPGELPGSWGLLVPRGRKLIQKVEAKRIEKPQVIDRRFLAAVLRRAAEKSACINTEYTAAHAHKRFEEGLAQGEANSEFKIKQLTREAEEAKKWIAEFEQASGVNIRKWGSGQIGEALNVFMHQRARVDWGKRALEDQIQKLTSCLGSLKEALTQPDAGDIADYLI